MFAKLFSARWFKITASIFSFLLIAVPAAFSVWWYMFTSTPPYQWFKEHGLPHAMNNPLWLLMLPVSTGLVLLVLIWRDLLTRQTGRSYDAVTFGNAIIVPGEHHDVVRLPSRRSVTDDQAGKIIDKLKELKLRPVMVTTRQGAREDDLEAHEYAVKVKKVLSQAGVTINEAAIGLGTLFPTGVSIFAKPNLYNDVTVSAIIDAIRLTGVECKTRERQVWAGNGIEPEVNLIIGANEITPPS